MNTFNYNCPAGIPMFPLYGYDNSEDLDSDINYVKSMYPSVTKRIQKEIEEECDKLEYDGSCMFDAFPDKNHLGVIINVIYNKVHELEQDSQEMKTESLTQAQWRAPYRNDYENCSYCRCPRPLSDYCPNGRPDWLRSLIEIMFYNEILNRRRRYRSRKRWF